MTSLLGAANPMLPTWAVLPLAGFAMLVISGHLLALRNSSIPASRRRIRMASGVVMIGLTALLAYALAFVDRLPSSGGSIGNVRAFVLVWMAIIGLLPLVLALAGLDVLNTVRLQRAATRELRRQLGSPLRAELDIRVRARLSKVGGAGSRTGGVASASVDEASAGVRRDDGDA